MGGEIGVVCFVGDEAVGFVLKSADRDARHVAVL